MLLSSCGGDNIFSCPSQISGKSCEKKSLEEQAKDLINNGQYDEAITLLQDEILARDSADYSLQPLLATAYAYKVGINIFAIAVSASGSGGSDVRDLLGHVLPSPSDYTADEYDSLMATLNLAIATLNSIPISYMEEIGHEAYQSSVTFQTSLYNSSLALMILNRYLNPSAVNPDSLDIENISAADAQSILSSLQAAAGDQDNPMAQAASKMLEKIDQSPGATTEEKISNYAQSSS